MSRQIVIFGREPIPGRVKTRLARDVGAREAAAIYTRLLEHSLQEALSTGIPVLLSLAEELQGCWTPPEGLPIEVQPEGDLGSRMHESIQRRFRQGLTEVLLVGSDCPVLNRNHIFAAFEALKTAAVVLGPARDGGYWAIGQSHPGVDCFTGVPWSSAETLEATREILQRRGVTWRELEQLFDIDVVTDLDGLDDGILGLERLFERG